jgi:hypothetical protein
MCVEKCSAKAAGDASEASRFASNRPISKTASCVRTSAPAAFPCHRSKGERITAKKYCGLLSGGKLDVSLLARIIEQGMVRDGRLLGLRVLSRTASDQLHNSTR